MALNAKSQNQYGFIEVISWCTESKHEISIVILENKMHNGIKSQKNVHITCSSNVKDPKNNITL